MHDDVDAVGATLFHTIYDRYAWLTFSDELGEDLAKKMLGVWYFWQERFQQMVLTDHLGHWFDDTTTAGIVEGKREILIRAAIDARAGLFASLGRNPERWQWGNGSPAHLRQSHPARRLWQRLSGGRDASGSGFRGGAVPGEIRIQRALFGDYLRGPSHGGRSGRRRQSAGGDLRRGGRTGVSSPRHGPDCPIHEWSRRCTGGSVTGRSPTIRDRC